MADKIYKVRIIRRKVPIENNNPGVKDRSTIFRSQQRAQHSIRTDNLTNNSSNRKNYNVSRKHTFTHQYPIEGAVTKDIYSYFCILPSKSTQVRIDVTFLTSGSYLRMVHC